jgi:peptide deformylase
MGKILNIITAPDERLRQRSKEVDAGKINTKEIQEFCGDLAVTMKEKDGIGLAAPQTGNNIRVVVISTKDGDLCMINPVISKRSWSKEYGEEGCLSVPGIFGLVRRHKSIKCSYYDKQGKKKTIEAKNLFARVIQHEIDHLDGILFIDKAKDLKELQQK